MGLEVVVRPVVLPNIRPAAPRVLLPSGSPESGLAVISGGGGKFFGTSHSWSFSISQQTPHKETKRQVDVLRVHQKNDDGTINNNNFIDVERLKKVRLDGGDTVQNVIYSNPRPPDNVTVLETDATRLAEGTQPV
jgi:hypothetical protein